MDNDGKLLLTEPESFRRLSIGRSTFRKLMASGAIEPVRIGRSVRFRVSDLEALVERLIAGTQRPAGGR